MSDTEKATLERRIYDRCLVRVGQLEAENAELRELVRKVEHYESMGCDECPYEDSCDAGTLYDEECAMSREIEREKGELGIEVD